MAVGMIFSPPKDLFTTDTYAKVMEHLGAGFPPGTMNVHLFGHTAQGEVRIVDVFESAEAFEAFAQSHAPVYEALGISVHTLRNWEQGRRRPEGPALALLRIAARHPRIIRENLERAA